MSEQNAVELFEEWQTGAFLLIGSVAVGFLVGSIVGAPGAGYIGLLGLVGGTVLAFLVFSYLLYGR